MIPLILIVVLDKWSCDCYANRWATTSMRSRSWGDTAFRRGRTTHCTTSCPEKSGICFGYLIVSQIDKACLRDPEVSHCFLFREIVRKIKDLDPASPHRLLWLFTPWIKRISFLHVLIIFTPSFFQSGHVCCFPRETMEHRNNSYQVEPGKLWQGMSPSQTNQHSHHFWFQIQNDRTCPIFATGDS